MCVINNHYPSQVALNMHAEPATDYLGYPSYLDFNNNRNNKNNCNQQQLAQGVLYKHQNLKKFQTLTQIDNI